MRSRILEVSELLWFCTLYINLMVFWPCIIVQTWLYHQLSAQFYLFNNNITSWSSTCFEHRCAHLQEDNLQYLVSSHSVCCHTEWDDTRYCKYTIVLLKMSTEVLETGWGSWCNIIIEQIKLCIKLVINSSLPFTLFSEDTTVLGNECQWKHLPVYTA
jgi:hypothetical protein